MSAVTTGCCCGSTGCAGTCLLTSYTVSGLGGSYQGRVDYDYSCPCYTDICGGAVDSPYEANNWEFLFTASQIGTAVLTRYGPVTFGGCCYKAEGTMRITGTLTLEQFASWFSCDGFGPPAGWAQDCSNTISVSFTAEVPFCYTVACDSISSLETCTWGASGAIWKHSLQICDFPISGSEEFLAGSCPSGSPCSPSPGSSLVGPDCILCLNCPTQPYGIICSGGTFNWISKLKDFRYITASERGEISSCAIQASCPLGAPDSNQPSRCFPDLENIASLEGPFLVALVDEFSDDEGPDPWIPCSYDGSSPAGILDVITPYTSLMGWFGRLGGFDNVPELWPCQPCGSIDLILPRPGDACPDGCATGKEFFQTLGPTYPTYS